MPAQTASLDDIRASFAFFDNWEDRYRFLIDLGRAIPPLPDEQRTERNLVRGCQSQVWLVARHDGKGRLHLAIDSDAHIVRGLIAVVLAAYHGKSPAEMVRFNVEALFEELALLSHLTPTRGNGLLAIVSRIRAVAAAQD